MNINFQSIPDDNDDFRCINDTISGTTDSNSITDITHKERRIDMDDYSYSNPLLSDITNPNDYYVNRRSLEFVSETSHKKFKGMNEFTTYSKALEGVRELELLRARGIFTDLHPFMPKPNNNN